VKKCVNYKVIVTRPSGRPGCIKTFPVLTTMQGKMLWAVGNIER